MFSQCDGEWAMRGNFNILAIHGCGNIIQIAIVPDHHFFRVLHFILHTNYQFIPRRVLAGG
jgi:hypothetical protein